MNETKESFPQKIEHVPPGELVFESFGWQFGTWGMFCAVAAVWVFMQEDPPTLRLSVAGGLLALAPAMLGYELRRRKNRTALAFYGGSIGIYRRGTLAMVVTPRQIAVYQTNFLNTIGMILLPLVLGLLGLAPVSDLFNPLHDKPPVQDILAGLFLTTAGLSSAVSLVWTRHVWRILLVPRSKGGVEDVNLTRLQASRFIL
jgi:hypothetical protein